jgi:hypothetical protein
LSYGEAVEIKIHFSNSYIRIGLIYAPSRKKKTEKGPENVFWRLSFVSA